MAAGTLPSNTRRTRSIVLFIVGICLFYAGTLAYNLFHISDVFAFGKNTSLTTQSYKPIALTFDDGPNGQATRTIVDILVKEHVPAAFFMVGKNVAADPATVQYVANHGFTIGNHTWDHSWQVPTMTHKQVTEELQKTSSAIQETTGTAPVYMRWPHGMHNATDDVVATALQLQPVDWQIDPQDYATNNADLLAERVVSQIHGGDTILFHDGLQDGQFSQLLQRRQATISALPIIIAAVRAQGYTFVSIEQLAAFHHQ